MITSKDVVVVPTYKRPEFLACCLSRIRAAEPLIDIFVFPDRGTLFDTEQSWVMSNPGMGKPVYPCWVPKHDYYGNTFNAMEALRFAWNMGNYNHIFYIEDDVMVHPDFFDWHREQLEEVPELFCSMGWVFNRHAPIDDAVMYQPWYYAIGTCFPWARLSRVIEHATPEYYADMQGYIERTFRSSHLNSPYGIQHFEQDGLIQRVLDQQKMSTASCGVAKCDHIGTVGYNRGWNTSDEFFAGCRSLHQRIERVEELIADPYWRASVFGRDIVEREVGRTLPPRTYRYKIEAPGGFTSEFSSELDLKRLPKRINSVPVTPDTKIVLLS
jgi:hypothetical protein